MFYLNVESPKHRNDNTLNYRLFQTWVKSGLIYDSTVDKQHNYLYDLSKNKEAIIVTLVGKPLKPLPPTTAATAAACNKEGQNMRGRAVAVTGQAGHQGCCCPTWRGWITSGALWHFKLVMWWWIIIGFEFEADGWYQLKWLQLFWFELRMNSHIHRD